LPTLPVKALSRNWHLGNNELTSLLRSHFPEQMPESFQIDQLLVDLLAAAAPHERAITGASHDNGARSWGRWQKWCKSVRCNDLYLNQFSQIEQNLLFGAFAMAVREGNSRSIALMHWLKAQSEVPSHMWCRLFGNRADRIPLKMQTTCLLSFYQGSSGPIETTILKKCNKRSFLSLSSKN